MPNVPADHLQRLAAELLVAAGARPDDARLVADGLVEANLAGHDSHGVIRLLNYVEWARQGSIDPNAEASIAARNGTTAVVNGGWGWGQVAMTLAVETAIELAAEHGTGAVAVRRSNHVGRVGPYVARIADAGMVGLAIANANPAVAPYGGRARLFGTNPIAWGVPRGEGRPPLVHDIATAAVAEGKLRVARAKGEAVVPGLILDPAGQPSIDPEDFYAGGTLLPFGGHKGSGLSVLIQILGRGLAGADPDNLAAHRGGNGPVVLALDVRRFVPLETFAAEAEAVCAQIKANPAADGFEDVQLPGEPEERSRRRRLAEGVPVPERTWNELLALADELGVRP